MSDDEPYLIYLLKRLRRNIRGADGSKVTGVSFAITRDGVLENLQVVSSSGDEQVDATVLDYIKARAPFKELPTGSPDSVHFAFRFSRTVVPALGVMSSCIASRCETVDVKIAIRVNPKVQSTYPPENKDLYLDSVCLKIRKHILLRSSPGLNASTNSAILRFHITKDGSISNLHLHQSTGQAIMDQRALKAVQDAAPYEPLPESQDYKDPFIPVIATFDFELLPQK